MFLGENQYTGCDFYPCLKNPLRTPRSVLPRGIWPCHSRVTYAAAPPSGPSDHTHTQPPTQNSPCTPMAAKCSPMPNMLVHSTPLQLHRNYHAGSRCCCSCVSVLQLRFTCTSIALHLHFRCTSHCDSRICHCHFYYCCLITQPPNPRVTRDFP